MIMLGPLLTMGKNVSPEGYIGWMTRRIRAVMGTMGLESADIIWRRYISNLFHHEFLIYILIDSFPPQRDFQNLLVCGSWAR